MPKIKYSLQKIINDTNFFSRKYLFWKMIKYVISALHFLHTIGINHGNIKPNNLLIDDRNNFILNDFDDSKFIKSRWINLRELYEIICNHKRLYESRNFIKNI